MTRINRSASGADVKVANRIVEPNTILDSNTITGSQRAGALTLKRSGEQDGDAPLNDSEESRRVIVVSHNYSPMLNPRAFRWTAIAEQWAKQGAHIDVVCAWQSGLEQYSCVNGVHIHRVGKSLLERLRTLLISKERKSRVTSETASAPTNGLVGIAKRALKSIAHMIHDVTWKNLYWPDYATLWSKPAIDKVNSLLSDSNDNEYANTEITLLTVSDPFTAHVAGRALKKQRPNLRWVVDIGDPFCYRHDTPTNNHTLYHSYNYRYERAIFAECDSVSVTTEATKRRYIELFPGVTEKITVIPPLVSFVANPISREPLGNSPALKVLYTGALYRHIRNPEYLLRLFVALKEKSPTKSIELHFFGPADDCKATFELYQQKLGGSVFLHGLTSKDVTIAAMNQADLLLSIGNTSPYQLPSKVVEYACTSKPILNIASIPNDSSTEFFQGRLNTLTINASDSRRFEEHVTALEGFLQENMGPVPVEYREMILQRHSAETISASYAGLLVAHKGKLMATAQGQL